MKNSMKMMMVMMAMVSGGLAFSGNAHAQTQEQAPEMLQQDNTDLLGLIDSIVGTTVQLEQYVTLQESAQFLLPIKVLAGKTKAMIYGRGPQSEHSIAMCNLLAKKIQAASDFIDSRYSVDATFQLAIDLSAEGEALDRATE